MLNYVLRIRDLVHGTILFTKEEERIINHPFFQRLRQIRQNDVAFYVYPSMNTSRFEHTLGVCRIAGMMAETLTKSPRWSDYSKELKKETGISTKEEFVKICRFYALLHDIGHLPLSHLFEYAMESWTEPNYFKVIKEWTDFEGFEKLHEGFGALISERVIKDSKIPDHLSMVALRLMKEKKFPFRNPLYIIKSVIVSEIDADPIDFVLRDGLMAGGEYDHYDVRKPPDSVFIEQIDGNWLIAYSEKALTSMEALLLDRYRTYEWIHFHQRVIVTKMLVRFLIEKVLELKIITKENFNPENIEAFSLKDDVWLWDVLRNIESDNQFVGMAKRAVFYREKKNILNLWKTRTDYHSLLKKLAEKSRLLLPIDFEKGASYQHNLSRADNMDMPTLTFDIKFTPVTKNAVYLYSEDKKKLTGRNLFEASKLISVLNEIWDDEPQYSVLLIGDNVRNKAVKLKERWVSLTVDWIIQRRLW